MDSGTGDPVWRPPSPLRRVAIVAALEYEAGTLRRARGGSGAAVHVSGPGGERAAAAARRAVAAGADALVAWGLAGGLTAAAQTGTIVLPASVLGDDGPFPADAAWRQRLGSLLRQRFTVLDGLLCSVAAAVTTPAAKAALAARTGAVAVDMESAAVAAVAAKTGVAFVALRVIADGPAEALPRQVERLVTADGRTRYAGLAPMLVSPRELVRLIRLGRRSQRARRVLRRIAATLESGRR